MRILKKSATKQELEYSQHLLFFDLIRFFYVAILLSALLVLTLSILLQSIISTALSSLISFVGLFGLIDSSIKHRRWKRDKRKYLILMYKRDGCIIK